MLMTGKVLAEGQLAITKGTIYTVPQGKTAFIRFFSCYNSNSAAQTINIYIKPGSTSRQIGRYSLNQYESLRLLDNNEILVLEEGDIIEADTTTASAVDYVISGMEES
jgi:hypothetical protein